MTEHLTVVDHPLVQHKLTMMRQSETTTAEFRKLLRELTQLLAYEVTRDLPLTTTTIETPMETMEAPILADPNAFVSMALPAMSRQYEAWLKARAARVYLPIEIRVMAFNRRTGAWPTAIEEIVDDEIPIDPATGEPLKLFPAPNENDPPQVGRADLLD